MKLFNWIFNCMLTYKNKKEYKLQKFVRFNERAVEYNFVFKNIVKIYPKTILDIGSGLSSLPHLLKSCGMMVTAIDNYKDYWNCKKVNKHFYIKNESVLNPKHQQEYDMVLCISTLEHIENFSLALSNMVKFMHSNSVLIITFPATNKSYVKNCYDLKDSTYGQNNKFITQSFTLEIINNWCNEFNLKIIDKEFWEFWTGDYWTCGSQVIPPKQDMTNEKFQLACIAFMLKSN